MDNNLLQIKVQQRLNKIASEDYDNLEGWQIQEAFNKAQIEWCRRQIHGNNPSQEGDESSKMRIDDLQKILTRTADGAITLTEHERYFVTDDLPTNYLYFKRMSVKSTSECCDPAFMRVGLQEEANVDDLLADELSSPSIEWGETFCTIASNQIKVYTNGAFKVQDAILHYYRFPVSVEILGSVNPSDDTVYTANVICEFKDDIVELMIDGAASILATDLELFNIRSATKESETINN